MKKKNKYDANEVAKLKIALRKKDELRYKKIEAKRKKLAMKKVKKWIKKEFIKSSYCMTDSWILIIEDLVSYQRDADKEENIDVIFTKIYCQSIWYKYWPTEQNIIDCLEELNYIVEKHPDEEHVYNVTIPE